MPVNYEPNKVATDPLAQYIAELKTQKTKEKQIKEAKSKSFLRKMGEGIVRPFAEVGASVYNVGGAIGQLASGDEEGARQTLQQSRNLPFIGETKPAFTGEESAGQFAKKVGGYGLEIGSTVMGGGGTVGVAKAGLKGLVKEGLKTGVKAGLVSGLAGGAGMSLKEDKSTGEVLLSSLMGGAFGTVAGGVLGAATPVFGKAARSVLLPVEQKISNTLRSAIDKGIKPYFTNSSKAFRDKYYQNAEKAFLTIFENKPKIMSEELGEEVAKLPTNRAEMLEALYKTKQAIYNQFHQVAVDAGDAGAKFDVGDIISNLDGVVQSKKYSPDIRNYAESLKAELEELAGEAPEVIEARIQDLNNSLGGFYEGRVSKAKAQVDASVAKLMRDKLDGIIEKATGEPYQVLKNKYGALKTVEKDLARQVANEARKAQKGLIDFTDIFTGGDLITGVVTGNPLLFAKGLAGKGIKEYMKFMNNPNRFIKEAFDVLDNPPADIRGMLNKAGEYINTHAGLSIKDVSTKVDALKYESRQIDKRMLQALENGHSKNSAMYKNLVKSQRKIAEEINKLNQDFKTPAVGKTADNLLEEAKKYKSAEEFVKAQPTYYHGGDLSKTSSQNTGMYGNGLYLTNDKLRALEYGKINEVVYDKNIKLYTPKDNLELFGRDTNYGDSTKITDKVIKMGYDGIKLKGKNGAEEIVIFDPSQIKTKSQLIDIWNKANATLPETSLIQEAKKYKSAEEFVNARGKEGYVDIKKLEVPDFNNGIEVNGWHDIYRKSNAKTMDKMDKDINYLLANKNNELEPILIKQDGKFLYVEDGHHRVASYISAGREKIPFKTVKTKSQLTDIWNKANATKTVNNLAEEAKKYKSAEEFADWGVIMKKDPVVNGKSVGKDFGELKDLVSFRKTSDFLKQGEYKFDEGVLKGKIGAGQELIQGKVDHWKARISKGERPIVIIEDKPYVSKITDNLQGGRQYDAILEARVRQGHSRLEAYRQLGIKKIPVVYKSQLIDIWNKANKK